MKDDLVNSALDYAGRGWPVVPLHSWTGSCCTCGRADCSSPAKHPRTTHGLKDATDELSKVCSWWERWPHANVGLATGIAFDHEHNLYVGDRSGTVFKISPNRQIFVFATLEPSLAAYHLAFGPDGWLYVTGPTTSSFDAIHRISSHGEVEVFYRGLGRPQGLAFDEEGRLYAAASIGGRRGVVRITPQREAQLFLSGPGIVGLAFSPSRAMIVATTNALFRVDVGIKGRTLIG